MTPLTDLNDLAYFAAVAEHGGFAAAERATDVPKSKLSRRVAQLEGRLGTRLIQRTTRRFALTDTGLAVLEHARAMLAEAQAAEALVAADAATPRGSVRLSCPPALLQSAVAPMLARYLNAWPQVRLHVHATNANVDVWEGGVDLALRVRPPGGPLPREETVRPLALSPHVLVASPRLLSTAMPPTEPEQLARLPTLGLGNSEQAQTWHLSGPGGQTAVVPHTPRLIADDMAALLDAALAGVGCAPLPRLLAHDALLRGDLQETLPGWAPQPWLVQVAFATRRGMRPAVRQLVDALAAGFEGLIREGRCLTVPGAPA